MNKVDKTSIHAFLSGFKEANMEGYVVKYTKGLTNSLRVKYKFNNYVEKHKGKSLSETAIKRSMKNMESINLDSIPDECYEAVKKIKTQMEEQFQCQRSKIENQYLKITTRPNNSPRDVIEAIKQSEHSQTRKESVGIFRIRGHSRPLEVVRSQMLNLDM